LFCGFPGYVFPEEADFASEGIDLNDLTGLLNLAANASLEPNATIDQVLDKSLFTGGVTRNALLPQFLITLPVLPCELWFARTTFLKTT
jgi:hypothetical protein